MSKFLIPEDALSQHVIMLGKTRSGKSSKMRLIIEHFLDRNIPVCIIDPKGDWWGLKSSADGKQAGYPIIIFGTEHARHADIRINAHSGAGVAELIATGNRPCLIDLRGMRVGERARFFVDFAAAFFTHARGQRVLAIDEVHNFAPQGKVPDPQTGEMLHWVNRLISEGGGMGITMLSASQRPQKVHKDFVTSNETLIATRVIHKLDRDAVKDWIDACGDPAVGKEVLASLAGMQRTEAWVYSPEAGFGPSRLTFPMFKTYDSFKPQSDKQTGMLKGWASIDLKEVETKLAHVVEEAKANDPKELRRQIADLAAKLKKAEAAVAQPAPTAPVDKPAEKKAAADRLAKAQTRGKIDGYGEAMKDIAAIFRELAPTMAKLKPLIDMIDESGKRIDAWATRTKERQAELAKQVPAEPVAPVPRTAAPRAPALPRPPRPAPTNGQAAGDGTISGVQQTILNAVAEMEALCRKAPPRTLVAMMANYKNVKSTGFAKALSNLSATGLVGYPDSGTVSLTDDGLRAAAPPATALTTADVQTRVIEIMGGTAGRILTNLIEAHPGELDREALAQAAGYQNVKSTGFAKALSRLSALGFVNYPSPRSARAGEILFP